MRFLENVHTEFTITVDGGEDRYFTLDLNAVIGDMLFESPTRYPYSLSIAERVKATSPIDTTFGVEHTFIPVVSGIVYISLDEIKDLKKDPYKFCIENGIIESNEETKSDTESKEEEEMPDIKKFYIRDTFNLLDDDIKCYPLFVKRECDDTLVINYDIMEKFLNMKNIKIRVAFGCNASSYDVYGGIKASAYDVYDPDDIYIHVGGTTLTASKYSSTTEKYWRTRTSEIEFRSEGWKSLRYAHVTILPMEES